VSDWLGLGELEGVMETLCDPDIVTLAVVLWLAVTDCDWLGDTDWLGLTLGVCEIDGDWDEVCVMEGDTDAVWLCDSVCDTDGLPDCVSLAVTDALCDGVAL
jgi:hypothetical protein